MGAALTVGTGSVPGIQWTSIARNTNSQDLPGLENLVRFICKVSDFKPRYNLAPRQQAPVLVWENGTAILKPMRCGLIPSWAKDEAIGNQLTNARADTLTEKPSYLQMVIAHSCLPEAHSLPAPDLKLPRAPTSPDRTWRVLSQACRLTARLN